MRLLRAFPAVPLIMISVAVFAQSDPATPTPGPRLTASQVVDRFLQRESELIMEMRQFHPLLETYVQTVRRDGELGSVPTSDRYFLGRLDVRDGVHERLYTDVVDEPGKKLSLLSALDPTRLLRSLFSIDFLPTGFSAMIFPDPGAFDTQHYTFQFLRREFLGEVRCLVFEVAPKHKGDRGRFLGRIWVEDRNFNIVRFNGAYINAPRSKFYFHMDSWRMNVRPGLWLPVAVYTEESDLRYSPLHRDISLKAQTRLWAYDLKYAGRQEEFTDVVIDAPRSEVDDVAQATNASPVASLRSWRQQAEENALDRLEKAGLLAASGPVDKVLETVVNNLQVTNNLDIQPEVRCRVLLTMPLESFTIGHTIVISRGLLDVLPDEASLAMVLSHELAHLALGDQTDTKYAFGDRMAFADEQTFRNLSFSRTPLQEEAADKRALELLNKSPYRDKLPAAGLFLHQLAQRAPALARLNRALLGNSLFEGSRVRMPELLQAAPRLELRRLDQVAALPLGSRIELEPWGNQIQMLKAQPVTLQSASEKMPLEVAPVLLNLHYAKAANGGADGHAAAQASGDRPLK